MNIEKSSIRFYVWVEHSNGTKPDEIYRKLKTVLQDDMPTMSTIYRWIQRYSDSSNISFDDVKRSGRPTVIDEENVSKVKALVNENPHLTVTQLCDLISMSYGTVKNILHNNLGLTKVSSVWVPHTLSQQNKQQSIECCHEILNSINSMGDEEALRRLITEDETWIMYSPGANQQDIKIWHKTGTGRPQIPKVIKTFKKTLTMICFSGDRKVYMEGTALGETINSNRYTEVLQNAFTKFGKEST